MSCRRTSSLLFCALAATFLLAASPRAADAPADAEPAPAHPGLRNLVGLWYGVSERGEIRLTVVDGGVGAIRWHHNDPETWGGSVWWEKATCVFGRDGTTVGLGIATLHLTGTDTLDIDIRSRKGDVRTRMTLKKVPEGEKPPKPNAEVGINGITADDFNGVWHGTFQRTEVTCTITKHGRSEVRAVGRDAEGRTTRTVHTSGQCSFNRFVEKVRLGDCEFSLVEGKAVQVRFPAEWRRDGFLPDVMVLQRKQAQPG
ncbi:MAG TPA: hypothetical protein VMZ92_04610 [Planctomycetota bacterium]|nr:hypothetical protein [Planctomycetota bacterium]